jgi:hypothetical protein
VTDAIEITVDFRRKAPSARQLRRLAGYTTRGKFRMRRMRRRLFNALRHFAGTRVDRAEIVAATERALGERRMLVLAGHVPARRS